MDCLHSFSRWTDPSVSPQWTHPSLINDTMEHHKISKNEFSVLFPDYQHNFLVLYADASNRSIGIFHPRMYLPGGDYDTKKFFASTTFELYTAESCIFFWLYFSLRKNAHDKIVILWNIIMQKPPKSAHIAFFQRRCTTRVSIFL